MKYLPPLAEQGRLIRDLKGLIDAQGFETFVSAPLLEPRPEHFPDPWRADGLGVERLARRLLTYAGLAQMEVDVELFESETKVRAVDAAGRATSWSHRGAIAWFAGIDGTRCYFGADVTRLATPDFLVGIMAHEVAHAFRRFHHREARDRQTEEELTDLTTVYLGFGILSTNASYRYRQQGEFVGTGVATRWSHDGGGYLSPQAMSFLLAVQAVARALAPAEIRRIAARLETNQASYFKAACESLDREALVARLGLPPRAHWPAVEAPAPRAFDTSGDPPLPDPIAHVREGMSTRNEQLPVFRVQATAAGRYMGLATLVAVPVSVACLLVLPWWGACAVGVVAVGAAGSLGKRRRRDLCSEPDCPSVIPAEADRCPGCGGLVSGRIRHQDDRLEAREALLGDGAEPEAWDDDAGPALDPDRDPDRDTSSR